MSNRTNYQLWDVYKAILGKLHMQQINVFPMGEQSKQIKWNI